MKTKCQAPSTNRNEPGVRGENSPALPPGGEKCTCLKRKRPRGFLLMAPVIHGNQETNGHERRREVTEQNNVIQSIVRSTHSDEVV